MLRALECDLITRRIDIPKHMKEVLWERQEGKCAECAESLGESLKGAKFDVCHKRVRRHSIREEGNRLDNLVLKCRPCHAQETELQDMGGRSYGHTLASHMTPVLAQWFKLCKPKQQSGRSEEEPKGPVYKIDAGGSRPESIFNYPYPLPIFSPMDEPEKCHNDSGHFVRSFTEYDYIWVDATGDIDIDNADDLDHCMPYDGAHLYPAYVVIQFLREHIISPDHCIWGVIASRGVEPNVLRASVSKLRDCISEVSEAHSELLQELFPPKNPHDEFNYYEYGQALVRGQAKGAVLEMLGIMCKDERRNWSIYRSTREDDVPASDNIKVVHNLSLIHI